MKLSKETIKGVSKALDELVDWNKKINGLAGAIAEFADGRMYMMALEALNDAYADKIPEKYLRCLEELLQAFIQKDKAKVTLAITQSANAAINIPYLDETEEGDLIAGILSGLVQAITRWSKREVSDIDGEEAVEEEGGTEG